MQMMTSSREITIYQLDVFADKLFAGNPACVCLLPWKMVLSEGNMMKISAEMGCTVAFLSRIHETDSFAKERKFNLRWFTSKTEIKLCGHATLATAAVLFRHFENKNDSITFITSGGDLVVKAEDSKICMDLPVGVSSPTSRDEYNELLSSFGDWPDVEEVQYCSTLNYVLICLKSKWTRQQFEEWTPDISRVHKAGDNGVLKAAIITMGTDADPSFQNVHGKRYDFASRVFGPWIGAAEDPVTGSAHTILGYYWSKRLGRKNFFARQCSPRGGDVDLEVREERVELKGQVMEVLQGTLTLDSINM